MIREINLINLLDGVVSVEVIEGIRKAGIETYSYRLTELPTRHDFGMPQPSEVTGDIIEGIQKKVRISSDDLCRIIAKLVNHDCAERKKIWQERENDNQGGMK